MNVTQIPVHLRDSGCGSEEFNDRFRGGSLSAQPAQPALDSAPDSLADVFGRFQVEYVMSEFDIFVFLNRWRRGLSDHGFASSVVDINVSFLPEMAGHVCQTGYMITGLVSAATPSGGQSHRWSKPQVVKATGGRSHRWTKPQVVKATGGQSHRCSNITCNKCFTCLLILTMTPFFSERSCLIYDTVSGVFNGTVNRESYQP